MDDRAHCLCLCHRTTEVETLSGMAYAGVPLNDPVHAATACSHCVNKHVEVFRDQPFTPPQPWTPQADGEGKEELP